MAADAFVEDDMREAFDAVALDPGVLTSVELSQLMANVGDELTEEEVVEFMKEADLDGDGKINCAQWIKVVFDRAKAEIKGPSTKSDKKFFGLF
jgi:calmodulin